MQLLVWAALIVVGVPAFLYFFWLVHCAMDSICMWHARRFCTGNGLEVNRVRCQSAFEKSGVKSGVKTESTLVQLDCFDIKKERRLVLMLTWPFGIRKQLSDEKYPEDYGTQWPESPR